MYLQEQYEQITTTICKGHSNLIWVNRTIKKCWCSVIINGTNSLSVPLLSPKSRSSQKPIQIPIGPSRILYKSRSRTVFTQEEWEAGDTRAHTRSSVEAQINYFQGSPGAPKRRLPENTPRNPRYQLSLALQKMEHL